MTPCSGTVPWLEKILVIRLRFFYSASSKGCITWPLGPEIRGSIGHVLKTSQGCVQDNNVDCRKCLEKAGCVYIKNFDRGGHKPKCFHLKTGPSFRSMKTSFTKGGTLQFDMVCFGHTIREIRKILLALRSSPLFLGKPGLKFYCEESGCVAPDGGFVPVTDVGEVNEAMIFRPVSLQPGGNGQVRGQISCIRFEIHTPTEISYIKQRFLQDPAKLSFETLVRKMIGRTEDVARHFFNFQWDKNKGSLQEYKNAVSHNARDVILVREPNDGRWQQVPQRNKQDKKFGGLVGSFVYKGNLTPYLGLLNTICCLGLGKNTISGFGHCSYQIVQE
jgi:hypothetical protein